MDGIFTSWGRILGGYMPSLSIEITRECPLRCPGCYAYGDDHLGGATTLRQLHDFKGQALIDGKFDHVGKIKGPILRGLSARAPFFHNGSARTLLDAVRFYEKRFGLVLTPQEESDLVAFLSAL